MKRESAIDVYTRFSVGRKLAGDGIGEERNLRIAGGLENLFVHAAVAWRHHP